MISKLKTKGWLIHRTMDERVSLGSNCARLCLHRPFSWDFLTWEGSSMAYELPSNWGSARGMGSPPRGWYRHSTGALRYWTGESWAGRGGVTAEARTPVEPVRVSSGSRTEFRRNVQLAVAWVAAIAFLGLLISDVTAGGVDCGTVFNPSTASQGSSRELCDLGIAWRLKEATLMAGAAVASLGVRRLSRYWKIRGCDSRTPVVVV